MLLYYCEFTYLRSLHFVFGLKNQDPNFSMAVIASKIAVQGKSTQFHNHNYKSGIYNGYDYRSAIRNKINGSVCTNHLEYSGIVFGLFICPIEGFDVEEKECCGPWREQYCCRPIIYVPKTSQIAIILNIVLFICVPVSLVLVVIGVILYYVCKEGNYETVETNKS